MALRQEERQARVGEKIGPGEPSQKVDDEGRSIGPESSRGRADGGVRLGEEPEHQITSPVNDNHAGTDENQAGDAPLP